MLNYDDSHESSGPMSLENNHLSCGLIIMSPNVFRSNMLIIIPFYLNIISQHSQRRLVLSTSVINQLCRGSHCETSPSFGPLMKSPTRHPANTLIKAKQLHSWLHHIITPHPPQWLSRIYKKIIRENSLNVMCFRKQKDIVQEDQRKPVAQCILEKFQKSNTRL